MARQDPLYIQLRKAVNYTRKASLTQAQLERLYQACEDGFLVEPYRQSNKTYNHWYRACKAIKYPFGVAVRAERRGYWRVKVDTFTAPPTKIDISSAELAEGELYRGFPVLFERATKTPWQGTNADWDAEVGLPSYRAR